jgi:hypothetical protein
MASPGPQTQPGVVEAFAADLAEAVAYAKEQGHEPASSGAIYGGVAGGMNDEADEFIKMVMAACSTSSRRWASGPSTARMIWAIVICDAGRASRYPPLGPDWLASRPARRSSARIPRRKLGGISCASASWSIWALVSRCASSTIARTA